MKDMQIVQDTITFDSLSRYGVVRVFSSKKQPTAKSSTRFATYRLQGQDSAAYLPKNILGFELQGVYMNTEEEDSDDIDRFCFYVNPKTKDVLMLIHMYYIGNPTQVQVFAHNPSQNPFPGNEALLKDLLRLDVPLQSSETLYLNFKVTSSSKPPQKKGADKVLLQ
jgi:hypothetical protein